MSSNTKVGTININLISKTNQANQIFLVPKTYFAHFGLPILIQFLHTLKSQKVLRGIFTSGLMQAASAICISPQFDKFTQVIGATQYLTVHVNTILTGGGFNAFDASVVVYLAENLLQRLLKTIVCQHTPLTKLDVNFINKSFPGAPTF